MIALDRSISIPFYSPVCSICKHFKVDSMPPTRGEKPKPSCAAFPDGLPLEVWLGKNKHITPIAGDHGIQFERVEMPEGEKK
jgi:hypothetical protein